MAIACCAAADVDFLLKMLGRTKLDAMIATTPAATSPPFQDRKKDW